MVEAMTTTKSNRSHLATYLAGRARVVVCSGVGAATVFASVASSPTTLSPTPTVVTSARRVATTLATLVAAAGAVATTTAREVGGNTTTKTVLGVVKVEAVIVGEEMAVHIIQGEDYLPTGERGQEAVIVGAKASKNVRDDLILMQWLADLSECVRQGLHMVEVICRRRPLLLGDDELHTRLDGTCSSPGGEHPLQDCPCFTQGRRVHDMRQDVVGDGVEDAAEDGLITDVPGGVVRVVDLLRLLCLALAAGGGDGLGGHDQGVVDVAEERVFPEVGEHLHFPGYEVFIAKPNGD